MARVGVANDTVRSRFEAWWASLHMTAWPHWQRRDGLWMDHTWMIPERLKRDGSGYRNLATQAAWVMWQAGPPRGPERIDG